MEEIYNKMNEMIELGKNQEELSKQIVDTETELEQVNKQLEITQSSLTRPILERNKNELENKLTELKNEKQASKKDKSEKFKKEKEELLNLISRKLDQYKSSQEEIDEALASLEDIRQEKEKWNKLIKETSQKRNDVIEKIKNTGFVDNNLDSLTQKIKMAEAKVAELENKENAIKDYKLIEDNIQEIRDIEYLKMRVNGYDVDDIEEIAQDSFYKELTDKKAKEEEKNVEDIPEEEEDVESVLEDAEGVPEEEEKTVEDVTTDENEKTEEKQNSEKINNEAKQVAEESEYVADENEETKDNEETDNAKQEEPFEIIVSPEEQVRIEENYEKEHKTINMMNNESARILEENETRPEGKHYAQEKIKETIVSNGITAENKNGQQEKIKETIVSNEITTENKNERQEKIKRIIIGKGITIENKNGQQEKFKFKTIRKNLKTVEERKLSEIQEAIKKISPNYSIASIDEKLGEKIDPNVLFALQKATEDYGVSQFDADNIVTSYIKSLSGDKQEQEKMKDFITYDRTKMDVWRPSSFFGKIRNAKWFEKLKEYKEEAREFAKIIEDKPRRTFKQWLTASKPVQLLGDGADGVANKIKQTSENASKFYDKKKTQAKEFKEKIKVESEIDKTQVLQGTTRWKPTRDIENKKSNEKQDDAER